MKKRTPGIAKRILELNEKREQECEKETRRDMRISRPNKNHEQKCKKLRDEWEENVGMFEACSEMLKGGRWRLN